MEIKVGKDFFKQKEKRDMMGEFTDSSGWGLWTGFSVAAEEDV